MAMFIELLPDWSKYGAFKDIVYKIANYHIILIDVYYVINLTEKMRRNWIALTLFLSMISGLLFSFLRQASASSCRVNITKP